MWAGRCLQEEEIGPNCTTREELREVCLERVVGVICFQVLAINLFCEGELVETFGHRCE